MRARLWAVAVSTVLLAGCTSSETKEPAPPPEPTSTTGASEVDARGVVSVGFVGAPATLDPYSPHASDLTRALVRPLLPSLFTLRPDGSAEPALAQSVEGTGNRLRVTLAAQTWSNGRKISASDVAASVSRARPPSAFAFLRSARAISQRELVLRGNVEDWPGLLATSSFVMPEGRWDPQVTSGPLEFGSYSPDAELRLRAAPDAPVAFKDWRLRFFDQTASLIAALDSEDLDVAVLPSTVNLAERLDRQGIDFAAELGWEWIGLRTDATQSYAVLADPARVDLLQESFVRDHGEVAELTWPSPSDGETRSSGADGSASDASFAVAYPTGDELLAFIVETLQLSAQRQGAVMELAEVDARTFYGQWQRAAPVEVLLQRSAGAPFLSSERPADVGPDLPLFRVETFLAWSEGMEPLAVNPTIEGPLWDVTSWRRAAD